MVSKLAPHGFVEFLDAAANNFHKPYYNSIRRCEEVIYKIDHVIKQVRKYQIELPEVPLVGKIFDKQADSNFYIMQSLRQEKLLNFL